MCHETIKSVSRFEGRQPHFDHFDSFGLPLRLPAFGMHSIATPTSLRHAVHGRTLLATSRMAARPRVQQQALLPATQPEGLFSGAADSLHGLIGAAGSAEGQLQSTLLSAEGALDGAKSLELVPVLQGLGGLVGSAWATLVSPFAIFGPEMGMVNVLFILAFGLLAYNLVAAVPRQ